MELTLPGFRNDFGSSVYPLGAGSPFFRMLPLRELGLEWVHGEACVAHPLDDGTAVTLEHSFAEQDRVLGREDGATWAALMRPVAERWWNFADDALRSLLHFPSHPFLMARFGTYGVLPADVLAQRFKTGRTRALLAGLVGHSLLSFDQLMSSAVGMMFGATAVAVGWPVPKGGAQAIPDALIRRLEQFGGVIHTGRRIDSLDDLDTREAVVLCDVAPAVLLRIGRSKLLPIYRRTLERFAHGPGAFKIDYALSQPIPWKARECLRTITVHVGGSYEEIARGEHDVWEGRQAERPLVLVTQPSLFDATRAPEGKHTAWAYCHVPNGSTEDCTQTIEEQIERFAPGFRDCVLARRVWRPADLQIRDANVQGGDINAGAFTLRQMIFRPGIRSYRTGTPGLYLCSAATPPGGGVHGMCGYHAAQAALRDLRLA